MVTRRTAIGLALVAAGATLAGGTVAAGFGGAMAYHQRRVSQGARTIATSLGALEYAEQGTGTPLLMIHGTGGGFDQGLAFAAPLSAMGYRVIAPSRFGYLGSDFPADPSSDNQADVLVELLDHLGIDRLPVVGGSAGALPALALAIRHPDRVSACVAMVPASYVPDRPATPGPSGLQLEAMNAMLRSDFLFWAALSTMPELMIGTMLATDPALVAAASPSERERVGRILSDILPISRRTQGLMNDARLAGRPEPMALDAIAVPTLAISVEDDRFGTAAAARYIASQVRGARLVVYPSGGHVWVGHDADMFGDIDAFLADLHIAPAPALLA